jgi:hypothetical protein
MEIKYKRKIIGKDTDMAMLQAYPALTGNRTSIRGPGLSGGQEHQTTGTHQLRPGGKLIY